jgi:hypothetical protein
MSLAAAVVQPQEEEEEEWSTSWNWQEEVTRQEVSTRREETAESDWKQPHEEGG